jgi:uncharacterized membrane protein required for colicin V production
MLLNDNLAKYFNIGIIIFLIVSLLLGIKKGFVKQFFELLSFLVALFAAIIFSPILARYFRIFHLNSSSVHSSELIKIMDYRLNSVIWFFAILIVVSLVLTVIKIFVHKVGELPVLKIFNRFLGGVFGFISGMVFIVIISLVLSSPFFINGKEFKEKTLFVKFDKIANSSLTSVKKMFNENETLQAFIKDPKAISEEQRATIEDWLIKNGFTPEDIVKIFESVED